MKRRIQSKILSDYLERALGNGEYKLRFDDIARDIFKIKCPKDEHLEAIRKAWHQAEKQLRRMGTCAMLVSADYFETYSKREPRGIIAIKMCIAGYGGSKAIGVRLLTMKGATNDPMALAYFAVSSRNLRGMAAAIEDRITVEWKRGHLSKRVARQQIDDVVEPALPEHQTEFEELMD